MTATNHSNANDDESGSAVSVHQPLDSADVDDPLGTVFSLLSHRRSRLALANLVETDEDVLALETLIDRVASAERDANPVGFDAHRQRVATILYHSVLPKLADAGIVDYDPETEAIRYRPNPRLEAAMERLTEVESTANSPEELETWLRLFASRRRRDVLAVLREHGETLTLADVADEVAVREREMPITEIPADDILQVYFSLYHTHVPKLVDAGAVEYDQETDTVTLLEQGHLDRYAALLLSD